MGVADGSIYVYSVSSSPISTVNLKPHVAEVLSKELISHADGNVNTNEKLGGKVIGLYFSAHWCPPCRAFTDKLKTFYHSSDNRNSPIQMEVVFVSCDRSEEEFTKYFQTMPWLAVPYDSPQREFMREGFQIGGVPTLIIISPTGNTVCNNAINFNFNKHILETWATDLKR